MSTKHVRFLSEHHGSQPSNFSWSSSGNSDNCQDPQCPDNSQRGSKITATYHSRQPPAAAAPSRTSMTLGAQTHANTAYNRLRRQNSLTSNTSYSTLASIPFESPPRRRAGTAHAYFAHDDRDDETPELSPSNSHSSTSSLGPVTPPCNSTHFLPGQAWAPWPSHPSNPSLHPQAWHPPWPGPPITPITHPLITPITYHPPAPPPAKLGITPIPQPPPTRKLRKSPSYSAVPSVIPFDPSHPKLQTVHVMHALLRYSPKPTIFFDVSQPATHITNTKRQPLSSRVLAEAATQPPMPFLRITSPHLPWSIKVSTPAGGAFVTVGQVLAAIYESLQRGVTAAEYDTLPTPVDQKRVKVSWEARYKRLRDERVREVCKRNGVARVDFLMGRDRFLGLTNSPERDDTWVLNVV